MTPDQIKHFSNGIWTCSSCAEKIDKIDIRYTADRLLEMKKIRETAQQMAASDLEIAFYSRHISPIAFDEIFWNNKDNLDIGRIRREVKSAFHSLNASDDKSRGSSLSVPPDCVLKPVVKDIRAMMRHSDRNRALDILEAWAATIKDPFWDRRGLHIHYVTVAISARNPENGEICESSIRLRSDGWGQHYTDVDGSEFLRFAISTSAGPRCNLRWKLSVSLDKEGLRTSSELRLSGNLSPAMNLYPGELANSISEYIALLTTLAEGWSPIGYVNKITGDSLNDDQMHSEPFRIVMRLTEQELEATLYRARKIQLAQQLEIEWGYLFSYSDIYFSDELDLKTIQRASDDLRRQMGPPPYWYRGETDVLKMVGNRGVVLRVREGILRFEEYQSNRQTMRL